MAKAYHEPSVCCTKAGSGKSVSRASVMLDEPSKEIFLLREFSEKESKGVLRAEGKRLSPPRMATESEGLKSMIYV